VLGHEGCGAVEAALSALDGTQHPERIDVLLRTITPGLGGIDRSTPVNVQIARGVEANVRWSMQQLQ
jgi:carbonic anhydrase